MPEEAAELLALWFSPETRARWYKTSAEFDARLRAKYGELLRQAAAGELEHWADTAEGALALVIVLDQLSRNIHRGEAASFAADSLALATARLALERGYDRVVGEDRRVSFFMPFMHSESLSDQEQCIALCLAAGDETTHRYAVLHRDLIAKFGRFPHRNEILGRESTPEELAYLRQPDAFRG